MESLVSLNFRIGRLWYVIFIFALGMLSGGITGVAVSSPMMYLFLSLILLYMTVCLTKNRLNDFGWSGWWMLIPLVNLVIMFVPGDKAENKYGKPN